VEIQPEDIMQNVQIGIKEANKKRNGEDSESSDEEQNRRVGEQGLNRLLN